MGGWSLRDLRDKDRNEHIQISLGVAAITKKLLESRLLRWYVIEGDVTRRADDHVDTKERERLTADDVDNECAECHEGVGSVC